MVLVCGDARDVLGSLPDASVDAVVTDPPYELGFMGKSWDQSGVGFDPSLWRMVLRVLKPGGHLLAFGGSRTYHRMACAIEDAGFEIRDQIMWIYGSGFPKSLDISKAIDKAAGAERDVVAVEDTRSRYDGYDRGDGTKFTGVWNGGDVGGDTRRAISAPATPEAAQWDGWGTALKPSHEPIVLARKPLSESNIAANVLLHGVGGINIAECRVGVGEQIRGGGGLCGGAASRHDGWQRPSHANGYASEPHTAGRWPANVTLDEESAALLDEQSGERPSKMGGSSPRSGFWGNSGACEGQRRDDTGGASRFFYQAKASQDERNKGLEGLPTVIARSTIERHTGNPSAKNGERVDIPHQNDHPTVKPIALMRWLCRLITPPGGTVLDCFMGSGTTGCAAALEGFNFIGIEADAHYTDIARRRIAYWASRPQQEDMFVTAEVPVESRSRQAARPLQTDMFT